MIGVKTMALERLSSIPKTTRKRVHSQGAGRGKEWRDGG